MAINHKEYSAKVLALSSENLATNLAKLIDETITAEGITRDHLTRYEIAFQNALLAANGIRGGIPYNTLMKTLLIADVAKARTAEYPFRSLMIR